jgi:aminoglycoside 6-adenylyltransferase
VWQEDFAARAVPWAHAGQTQRGRRIGAHPLMDQQRLLQDILRWAAGEANIRALILTGSMALGAEHVDALSDLDVELYVANESALLDDDTWYARFGEILVVEALQNPGWHPTRLVYYVDGKIDFMIGPVGSLAATRYERPFHVLLDKDRLTSLVPAAPPIASSPPSDAEVARCVNWFYAAALMAAKCIVRDDPWQAKHRDWDLKRELMHMIEWDHKTRYGWGYDTWSRGKRLKQWLDRDLVEDLDACWASFGAAENAAALLNCIDLFDRLATRTAHAMGCTSFDATRVREQVGRILAMARF